MRKLWLKYSSVVVVLAAHCLYAQGPSHVQTFPLSDTTGLVAPKVNTQAVTYLGRKSVRVTIDGDDHDGLALLPGTDFGDGVIEADIALKATVPPGVRFPGFVGIAFRARSDASHFELFYVRPGNTDGADQTMRNHVVQYSSAPDFGWYRLRREWPALYESHAEVAMETWIKIRIEVAGRSAKLYLDGSSKPSLIVDGLKGEDLHGAVGLWGFTDEEAYFSNVRITPAVPQGVKNGSDVAGLWTVQYSSDVGGIRGRMELKRDGAKVTGTWTGLMGEALPITGTWRDGYVELSFAGEWPKEIKQGAPGAVNAFLSGWIDGDSGKGRMRVEGHADGTWTAKRKVSGS